MKIKIIEDKIKLILSVNKEARDNDMLLISLVWAEEINPYNLNNMVACNFFDLMKNYEVSHATSIIRGRQKLQELYPEYRGSRYNKRHYKEEPETRNEIMTWKKDDPQLSLIEEEEKDGYRYP